MKIAVIGTGYVGLVTGTCFAETGHHVMCVDNNSEKVNRLQQADIPIFEPGLDLLFDRNTRDKRLSFSTDLRAAVNFAEIIFLALPTPPGEDGSADLSYVMQVAEELSALISHYTVIVNKSTVPVGTGEKVKEILLKKLRPEEFDVVSNPEFLREGVAVDDFLRPDRVVIGTETERATRKMKELYEPFVRQGNPIYIMDLRSAELTKYAANAYLAARISFMNEIANLCEATGANVDMVRVGMGSDNRIGKRFLFPGVGYGGSCFPKDVKALYHTAENHEYHFRILKAVMEVNEIQKKVLSDKIYKYFKGDLRDKKIAIWGLAFKPNTDDIREAPALQIITDLLSEGAIISAYDPEANHHVRAVFGDRIEISDEMYSVLDNADALAIITEWSVFRSPDFEQMMRQMKNPLIFDGRNVFEPEKVREKGFDYFSIGRE
ncbi:MAG: UDP-glucose/GDP-mannose dehydrogenase family protein [Saprospiraceae bacterium]|nr:UDP-glucose/GDP-mannose dehydrogenase family protein [Candidatus Vicinibacter affinis]MBK8641325.1 UDP-glucose/GDP-mannose dehydrogenase family protein [Candidatus Vicinibacter affinis]MBK9960335.1 UDP-glucose/GDP-mannose dehydrogenase family protein [Candidatus Vicinibacter affinis]